jgi:hypothetical protein
MELETDGVKTAAFIVPTIEVVLGEDTLINTLRFPLNSFRITFACLCLAYRIGKRKEMELCNEQNLHNDISFLCLLNLFD